MIFVECFIKLRFAYCTARGEVCEILGNLEFLHSLQKFHCKKKKKQKCFFVSLSDYVLYMTNTLWSTDSDTDTRTRYLLYECRTLIQRVSNQRKKPFFWEHLSYFSDTYLTFLTCVVECHTSVGHRDTPTPRGVSAS